jgi:putative transposase
LHNPIAVKVGVNGESEAALAKQLLAQLEDCLYLADRLYGNACVAALSLAQKGVSRVQFLLRVSGRPKPRVIEILKDGSALVEIKHQSEKMIVREIRGRVRKRNGHWTTVRLWTSLLDARRYPARELLELYGRRWEHEITYRELKRELREGVLLNAHTVETARQEIVALVMAQSMVSELRELIAEIAQIAVLEVSFPQDTAHGACPVVCAGAG